MTESEAVRDPEKGEVPRPPVRHPDTAIRKAYKFLTSAKLAMSLLVSILACCLVGVTILRDDRAWTLIFSTLWFNGLLVLLVVNVGCCFFGRIWGRKVTLISLGMILFHLSFVAVLGGIIYNSLFFFKGTMRITEGETLLNGERHAYDTVDRGLFFSLSKLKGETTLIKMRTGYKVEGEDKRVAYEVAVGEANAKKQDVIFITHNLTYNGFTYLPEKEGYSLLVVLYDRLGREFYGLHMPLQSLKQKDGSYLYTTGTKDGPGSFEFPHSPEKALFDLQVTYYPDPSKERSGNASFRVSALVDEARQHGEKAALEGKAPIGEKVRVGDYYFSAREVRYWAGMNVRYDPGKPIVLGSLWVGLAGIVLTTIGRLRRGRK
jgi:cytochrome c biogenesis protein ResB